MATTCMSMACMTSKISDSQRHATLTVHFHPSTSFFCSEPEDSSLLLGPFQELLEVVKLNAQHHVSGSRADMEAAEWWLKKNKQQDGGQKQKQGRELEEEEEEEAERGGVIRIVTDNDSNCKVLNAFPLYSTATSRSPSVH